MTKYPDVDEWGLSLAEQLRNISETIEAQYETDDGFKIEAGELQRLASTLDGLATRLRHDASVSRRRAPTGREDDAAVIDFASFRR